MGLDRRPLVALVVLFELGVAGACLYLGAQALHSGPEVALQRVGPPPPARGLTPELSPAPTLVGRAQARPSPPPWPALGSGLFDRLGRDDYRLYQKQWQVIELVMQGIRRYIEQRLVPSITSTHH